MFQFGKGSLHCNHFLMLKRLCNSVFFACFNKDTKKKAKNLGVQCLDIN